MLNEHDVKYDSDVVLAASVMSQKEKAYIVKCSLQRLSDISENKVPSSGESLLPQPTAPTQSLIPKQIQGNGPHTPRGRPPGVPAGQRMQVSSPRPGSPHVGRPKQNPVTRHVQLPRIQHASPKLLSGQTTTLPPVSQKLPPNFPKHLGVSISRVDPSVNCDMCKIVLPNKDALIGHMQEEHLSRFAGLIVATPGTNNKRQSLPEPGHSSIVFPVRSIPPLAQQIPGKRPRTVETPVDFRKLALESSRNVRPSINFSPQVNRIRRKGPQSVKPNRITHNPVSLKQEASPRQPTPAQVKVAVPSPSPAASTTALPSAEPEMPNPVIKCNTCGQYVKQSVFKSHKLTHTQEGTFVTTSLKAEIKESTPIIVKPTRQGEKLIDFVDLGDSDDESSKTTVDPKPLVKNISCLLCDKKLASNMALKMHMNLKHPVKTEAVDTEELLAEDTDDKAMEESQNKIISEVESMETLELLDNLVNFLNDT